jgi:hypothetical protein
MFQAKDLMIDVMPAGNPTTCRLSGNNPQPDCDRSLGGGPGRRDPRHPDQGPDPACDASAAPGRERDPEIRRAQGAADLAFLRRELRAHLVTPAADC